MSHQFDDTALTAYALGELSPEATAAVEAHLATNESARDTVAAIRASAAELKAALANEPAPSLTLPQRAAILNATAGRTHPRPAFYRRPATLAAAACLALAATAAVSVMLPSLNRAREVARMPAAPESQRSLMGATPSDVYVSRESVGESVSSVAPETFGSATPPKAVAPPSAAEPGAVPNTGMASPYVLAEPTNRAALAPTMSPMRVGSPAVASAAPSARAPQATAGNRPQRDLKFTGALPEAGPIELGRRVGRAPGQEEAFRTLSEHNTEAYARINDNPFLAAAQNPLSTFSIDVDTASYANVRRFLNNGQLPPADAVRIEEMVNYFPYDYPPPQGDAPFAANVEVAAAPWNPAHRLVRVALRGKDASQDKAVKETPKNLVFLIDVSGSMQDENKLPLLKESMKLLVGELNEQDKVTIAVYAGSSGLVLPTTTVGGKADVDIQRLWDEQFAPRQVYVDGKPVNEKQIQAEYIREVQRLRAGGGTGRAAILAAIDRLEAGGSTNGAAGITLAYEQAQSAFIKNGVNRVILCTDGDFNVGVTSEGELTRLIEEKAKTGVFLSVLGFGMGNVKDSTMEMLADKGNGNYGYIDTLAEAKKTLVHQMNGTLVTIAKDVKVQVEFNPAKVNSYRLIGYENRLLAKEDFNDDKKDAGEIGAGHTVTALYEVVPVGVPSPATGPGVDPLRYQNQVEGAKPAEGADELLTLKLRYKAPDAPLEQGTSKLLAFPVTDTGQAFSAGSADFRFATAVAAFGMILRDSPHKGHANLASVLEIAAAAKGEDRNGYRAELVELVKRAAALKGE